MYNVIDLQTGKTICSFSEAKAARRYRDKKDLEYGAIRYVVRFSEDN
jgi:hypothetical protein